MPGRAHRKMKILVIEDEVKAAAYLRQGLGESSYTVDVAHNGHRRASRSHYRRPRPGDPGRDAARHYLVKPFQFPELLARVRALLKAGQPAQSDPVVRVADLEIDATRAGQRIDLTAKEFALLTLLTQRSGEVLSRTRIASLVWDIHFGSDSNVVGVAMRRLRAKIDDPFPQKLIHTMRGIGYVLERRSEG